VHVLGGHSVAAVVDCEWALGKAQTEWGARSPYEAVWNSGAGRGRSGVRTIAEASCAVDAVAAAARDPEYWTTAGAKSRVPLPSICRSRWGRDRARVGGPPLRGRGRSLCLPVRRMRVLVVGRSHSLALDASLGIFQVDLRGSMP
jgi:hypothetical protein